MFPALLLYFPVLTQYFSSPPPVFFKLFSQVFAGKIDGALNHIKGLLADTYMEVCADDKGRMNHSVFQKMVDSAITYREAFSDASRAASSASGMALLAPLAPKAPMDM